MNWLKRLIARLRTRPAPPHLQRGRRGERTAQQYLKRAGLKFLTANYRTPRGEIDLVFRDGECLVFVEVKTRSSEEWVRPAVAVDAEKQRRLSLAALDYLRCLGNPRIRMRFDIVEVLVAEGEAPEVRHLPNAFTLTPPLRYG
mgnify:CR=1 FL=1